MVKNKQVRRVRFGCGEEHAGGRERVACMLRGPPTYRTLQLPTCVIFLLLLLLQVAMLQSLSGTGSCRLWAGGRAGGRVAA